MAWAYIGGGVSLTSAVTYSVTKNNLVFFAHTYGDTATVPTVSDSGGNVWTPVLAGTMVRDTTNGQDAVIWWCIAKATASITITAVSSGTFTNSNVAEYSNLHTNIVKDKSNSAANIAGSTGVNGQKTGSITPSFDGDLIISYIVDDGGADVAQQYAAGSDGGVTFTRRASSSEDPGGAGNTTSAWEDGVQTTAAAVNPAWTATVSHPAVGISGAFSLRSRKIIFGVIA